MEVDDPPAEQFSGTVSAARIEAFERVFGQHMRTHRLEDISIADIETVVNNNGVGASRYSADEIMALLEVHEEKEFSFFCFKLSNFIHDLPYCGFMQKLQDDNKVMISDGKVHII